MKNATLLCGLTALLPVLGSPASACDNGTLGQAANAHGLSAPWMPAPPAPDYACAAQPGAAATASAPRQPNPALASVERRRGRSATEGGRSRRSR